VDGSGQPTCSYRGGDPGFVKVVEPGTIAFPSYDGNGMFLSMGNIRATAKVGLLFIDFETPHRLRVQGLLAEHNVALTLTDGRWIPRRQMLGLAERPTGDLVYVRWMGPDRTIADFSRIQVDRTHEMELWSEVLLALADKGFDVYGYVNNHFAGHSPSSARDLQRLLGQQPVEPEQLGEQMTLF
jgi:uncharacterized protein YecE (DUF72 family)